MEADKMIISELPGICSNPETYQHEYRQQVKRIPLCNSAVISVGITHDLW